MTDLTDAIAHLEWFKIPHTIEDCCRIARDIAKDEARTAAGSSGGGSGGTEISDPTGNAAVAGVMADDARDAAATILGALSTIEDETARLAPDAPTMARKPGDGHTAPNARLSDVIADLHRLILNGAAFDAEQAGMVRVGILEPAEWLHRKGEGLWAQARPGQREPAVQKSRKVCELCGPLGRDVTPRRGERCDRCRDLWNDEKVKPTPAIVRWWESNPRLSTPPRLVNEARVSEQAEKRAARTGEFVAWKRGEYALKSVTMVDLVDGLTPDTPGVVKP